jgi:hypothetical protein
MDPWIIGGSCVIGWAACGAAGAKLADWALRPTMTPQRRRPWVIAAACLGPVVPAIALLFLLMITIFALLGIMK